MKTVAASPLQFQKKLTFNRQEDLIKIGRYGYTTDRKIWHPGASQPG